MENLRELFESIKCIEEKNNSITINLVFKDLDEDVNTYTEDDTIYYNIKSIDNMIINDDFDNDLNVYSLIRDFYHEIKHVIERNNANNGIVSDSTMFYIVTNLIDEYYDSSDYKRNYYYIHSKLSILS